MTDEQKAVENELLGATTGPPNVEPTAADLEHGREARALFLSYVRSGFTKPEAVGLLAYFIVAEHGRRHPKPDQPWEAL